MRFLHLSDIHLGANPGIGHDGSIRKPEQLWDVLEMVLDHAGHPQEIPIDFILITGDLFHNSPTTEELDIVSTWFGRIPKISVVLISGNHDHLHPESKYLSHPWPENVFFITGPKVTGIDFPEKNVTAYGMSYWGPYIEEPLLHELKIRDRNRINILLAHGGGERFLPYHTELLLEKGVDYIAAGHKHTRQVLVEDCAIVAGPLQPTEPKEVGEYGYWIVDMEKENGNIVKRKPIFVPVTYVNSNKGTDV